MFAGKTVWEIIQIGGFTMYVLLFCSFLSITILLERIIYYKRLSRTKRSEFMTKVKYPAAELRGIQLFRKLSSPLMGED